MVKTMILAMPHTPSIPYPLHIFDGRKWSGSHCGVVRHMALAKALWRWR